MRPHNRSVQQVSAQRTGLLRVAPRGAIARVDAGVVTVRDNTGARVVAASGASDLGRGLRGNVVYWTLGGVAGPTVLAGHPSDDAT